MADAIRSSLALRVFGLVRPSPVNASTFDTHAAVTALRDAGLDEAPAVAIVNTVRDAAAADHDALATRADIAEVKADIAALEARLVKWGVALAGAVIIVLGVLIRWP